jgi:hypothetical protein
MAVRLGDQKVEKKAVQKVVQRVVLWVDWMAAKRVERKVGL